MMSNLTDQQLLDLNKQGIIPGPDEEEDSFVKRAEYCLGLVEHFPNLTEKDLERAPESVIEEGFTRIQSTYDFSPSWSPVFFSNYKLAPWHGGCAWIFQMEETSPTTSMFQLKKSFKDHEVLHGIYNRSELISHEASHVGRMMFEEPKFEEYLAYRTSYSRFGKYFGPIVESSMETMWFVIFILAILLMDVYFIYSGQVELYLSMMWLKLIPLGMLLYALARLVYRHRQLDRCIAAVSKAVPDPKNALPVVFRLTDQEIIALGKMEPSKIKMYFGDTGERNLRCRLINLAYL